MSDEDIDLPLDDPPPVVIIEVVCGYDGCPAPELRNLGPKYVHVHPIPPDRAHDPEPVTA